MPSTYSTSLKLELIANGEQSGTWGQTTNNNLGTLIEQAITGVGSLTLVGDTTLTNYNGLPDESRNAVLVFSGSLSAPANVIAPSVQKTYIVTNNTGANVVVKTATGNGVTVQNGLSALIYCDGTEFYTAVNVNNVVGNMTVSGNITAGGSLSLGNSSISGAAGNLTMTANNSIIDMSVNTGALIPPTGTVAQRPATPSLGMTRWNSDNGQYEIWNGLAWQVIASGTYNISYLVIGGGGGAGAGNNGYVGGGGGAGGLKTATGVGLTPGIVYTITVGSGGTGTTGSTSTSGGSGANSSITGSGFSTVLAIGGGGGGGANPSSAGASGGSGGGGASPSSAGGSGTAGQGFDGATGIASGTWGTGGGGGGSAAVGSAPTGGSGTSSSITGSAVTYGVGGDGGTSGSGSAGTAYRGNGGSAGGYGNGNGGAGGSGVVILSIPTTNYTGTTSGSPTVTTNGNNTILTYTVSGTYTA